MDGPRSQQTCGGPPQGPRAHRLPSELVLFAEGLVPHVTRSHDLAARIPVGQGLCVRAFDRRRDAVFPSGGPQRCGLHRRCAPVPLFGIPGDARAPGWGATSGARVYGGSDGVHVGASRGRDSRAWRTVWPRGSRGSVVVRLAASDEPLGTPPSMTERGVTVPDWGGRRAADALQFVKARGRKRKTPCCICGQPINYSLPSTDPNGCSVQHIRARKLFPELTWLASNWAPAHLACNQSHGTGENDRSSGVTSQDW